MREMRLKKREITDPKILRKILESCEVVRIGAMDEEGMFIVPMNYGYDVREEDGTLHVCLYLHGEKKGGRRLHLQRIRAWRWRWITTMK